MARPKTANRRKPSADRKRLAADMPKHTSGWGRAGRLFASGWTAMFLITGVLLAAILSFVISVTVREWALEALGYGLIPVVLWVVCFVVVLRYRKVWIKGFWRAWLGSALLVAVSLGIMSMFHASDGVMKDASLGGSWGGYLGGSPTALGAVKVAILVLIGPLLLFPRRAATTYRRIAERGLQASTLSVKWFATHLPRPVNAVSARLKRSPEISVPDAPDPEPASIEFPEPLIVEEELSYEPPAPVTKKAQGWQLPPLELLTKAEGREVSQSDLQGMARHIEETLAAHRVEVAVEDTRVGPRVIRFGLVPGWVKKYRESMAARSKSSDLSGMEMSRVKVQSILVREKDIALALKTPYLRLEAPVPGEALVGLEVPNPTPSRVVLRSIAESSQFQKMAAKGGMPVALGEDTGGEPVVSGLGDLPHLLIAGATGSGKSVCINSIVASLLLTNRPDRLRMLMVDPKRVELTPFNGIPHLVAPVIVDTDEVLIVLRAIQNEMLHRYKLMEGIGVRNIEGYNKKASEHIPYLMIIIDELADLMMAAAYEVEQGLVRLAQLGRATGIHLILATQRPSVNVVTGLLKANIPARIAFAVASQVDSRVILDSVGAEKLLGKGDMLLLAPDSPRPKRVQGTFVDDQEIEKLVEFWRTQSGPPLAEIPLDEQAYSDQGSEDDDDDELLDRARELAGRHRRLSPSVLQRRLQVGYPRAMQLIELLEEEGLIDPSTEPALESRIGRYTPGI